MIKGLLSKYIDLIIPFSDVGVSLLPMDKIRLVWKSDVPLDRSILELPEAWMSNTHKDRIVTFKFICNNSTACKDDIVDALKESPELLDGLELEYVVSTKRTLSKTVAVSGNAFMSSRLFSKLKSMPEALDKTRYLTLEDVNFAADEIASSVVANIVRDHDYEASVDGVSVSDHIGDFLKQHKVSTEGFNDEKWNSVFWDPIMTRPDIVTAKLNEIHVNSKTTKDETRMSEHSSAGSGGVSVVLGLFGPGGSGSSASRKEIEDKSSKLWENKTRVEWTGEKFQLRAMDLYRVNLAMFETNLSVAFTDVKIYPYVSIF